MTRAACLPDSMANNSFTEELRGTAKYISRRGFGILASDESNATTGKRLATVGAACHRAWLNRCKQHGHPPPAVATS